MALADFWNLWMPSQPAISIVIWVLIFMLVLYIARVPAHQAVLTITDRKSTRLNSSHITISYAVFCLKKKKNHI